MFERVWGPLRNWIKSNRFWRLNVGVVLQLIGGMNAVRSSDTCRLRKRTSNPYLRGPNVERVPFSVVEFRDHPHFRN